MPPAKRTAENTEQLRQSLLEHAQRLIAREGAGMLTMRALAAEAGCAVGLPYKVFADREALVAELVHAEFRRLRSAFEDFVAAAGSGSVAENLGHYAELLLKAPAVALVHEIVRHDSELSRTISATAVETGIVNALIDTVAEYLAAEKRLGRVDRGVDEQAFAFLIAGAIHNLLTSGEAYPRPRMDQIKQMLISVATRIAPKGDMDNACREVNDPT